ncbi:uncharacterized protein LOC127522989 isoform X4 [Ctenopharyngodon idella]|uniref:uncharacterized protein LOC127522989 isoform X1 n=1 Tax=Ctenopharyngodon idella TaxID=7959 RepID=UPI00222EE5D8|nr:uncharacterized protein LOC127522989 isoform X1 [Ctenopharyngodon idella]XP_051769354.1 uncharacterized protein LOC127522989 isoform X3 [Ctenopharyngodon idella]XP_051769355.1 uncharacterized protein LOC127522989 isoform X4 [Ctenopharyngodon idella]
MVLLIIFTLLLEVQPQRLSDQVWLTASLASVQKDPNTAQLRYDIPTDSHSDQSHYNSVLNQKERPVITVTHDSQTGAFIIYCQIPGSNNTAYDCFIYIGDENRQILKSQKASGTSQCISALHENDLFNQLKSVKSKVMSCNYSPEHASSKRSPYSDKFNLTAFLPVQIQSPSTTKASTLYSTTFSTNETTRTALATESTTWYETTINPTAEPTHPSHPLNVTMNTTAVLKVSTPGETPDHTTPRTKTWLIMALAATSGGIFLTGLMGVCLSCIRQKPRKKSPLKTSAVISQSPDEDNTEENEEKLCHTYCTIPDVSEDTHELYSLAQMPNHSLLI